MRAFIAVDIPEEVKERIERSVSKVASQSVKVVKRDQMHVTLFFLGDVGDDKIKMVEEAMQGIDAAAFWMSVRGLGTFSRRNPHIVFAGVEKGADMLKEIHARLLGPIEKAGIEIEDREFFPHVTVLRVRHPGRKEREDIEGLMEKKSKERFGSFRCERLRLKRSVLDKEGAQHTDLFVKELRP